MTVSVGRRCGRRRRSHRTEVSEQEREEGLGGRGPTSLCSTASPPGADRGERRQSAGRGSRTDGRLAVTIADLVLALKAAAEDSELGLETPVFCVAPGLDEVLAVADVAVDDEGDCMISLA